MKRILLIIATVAFAAVSANAQVTPGWKIKADAGIYNASYAGTHDRVGIFEFGFGRQFNKYFYFGLQTGLWGPVESDVNAAIMQVPLSAVLTVDYPTSSRFTPLIDIALGQTVTCFGKGVKGFDKDLKPSYAIMTALPGFAFRLTDVLSLKFNIGYSHMKFLDGYSGHNQDNLVAKIGVVVDL